MSEPPKNLPDGAPTNEQLVDKFINEVFETAKDCPQDPEGFLTIVIDLVPENLQDDPRILRLIEFLYEQQKEFASNQVDEIPIQVGPAQSLVAPDAVMQDITRSVQLAVEERFDEQKRHAEVVRRQTGGRAFPVAEAIRFRDQLQASTRSFNQFAGALVDWCRERIEHGCDWWEEELPKPLQEVLQGVVIAGAAATTLANPALGVAFGVAIVAIWAKNRRGTDNSDEPKIDSKS